MNTTPQPSWIQRMKHKWNLKSAWQVVVILVVFACTGFTVLLVKKPILEFLSGNEEQSTAGTILYYIFILPLYNVLLLVFGFIFGHFDFFWQFERRFFKRIKSIFNK